MARDFDGTNDWLQSAAGISLPSAYPLSINCFVNLDRAAPNDTIVNLFDDGDANNARCNIDVVDDGGVVHFSVLWRFAGGDAASLFVDIDASYSTGTWHCLGVKVDSGNLEGFFDGTSVASTTHSVTYPALDRVDIGQLSNFTANRVDGRIAEVAIWDRFLDDAEFASLALNYSALNFPNGLVNNWQIIGRASPEFDIVGGIDLTVTSAPPASPHPPIIFPRSRSGIFVPAAAAAAANAPQLMMMGVGN